MLLTREQIIKAIVEERLDSIDSYTSFEQACENMIRNGVKGLANWTDEELLDEYALTLHPEEDVELVK